MGKLSSEDPQALRHFNFVPYFFLLFLFLGLHEFIFLQGIAIESMWTIEGDIWTISWFKP